MVAGDQEDANLMTALLGGALTAAFMEFSKNHLTQPIEIDTSSVAEGLLTGRFASGMLFVITVTVKPTP